MTEFLFSIFRTVSPLLIAALGVFVSERSGVIQLGMEGFILGGAFAAAAVAALAQSSSLGIVAGAAAGTLLAALFGLFAIRLKTNQVVVGMSLSLLAAGLTPFFCQILFESSSQSPQIPLSQRLGAAPALITVLVTAWIIGLDRFSRFGLWMRFAGEKPQALEAAGCSVTAVQWKSVLLSGTLGGLAGSFLSLWLSSGFARNMSAGRGFLAIVCVIMGSWKPIPTMWACLGLGLLDALQIRLQGTIEIPAQLIQIFPFLIALVVLASIGSKAKRMQAPSALGISWDAK